MINNKIIRLKKKLECSKKENVCDHNIYAIRVKLSPYEREARGGSPPLHPLATPLS